VTRFAVCGARRQRPSLPINFFCTTQWGCATADFGLASLFGLHCAVTRSPFSTHISHWRTPFPRYHHVNGALTDSTDHPRVHRVHVTAAGESLSPPRLWFLTYPDLPMEDCFVRPVCVTMTRNLYARSGKCPRVYSPWDLDLTFWRCCTDHGKPAQRSPLATKTGALSVEGNGCSQFCCPVAEKLMTVHLVNLTIRL